MDQKWLSAISPYLEYCLWNFKDFENVWFYSVDLEVVKFCFNPFKYYLLVWNVFSPLSNKFHAVALSIILSICNIWQYLVCRLYMYEFKYFDVSFRYFYTRIWEVIMDSFTVIEAIFSLKWKIIKKFPDRCKIIFMTLSTRVLVL